jgi:hypothetical protein
VRSSRILGSKPSAPIILEARLKGNRNNFTVLAHCIQGEEVFEGVSFPYTLYVSEFRTQRAVAPKRERVGWKWRAGSARRGGVHVRSSQTGLTPCALCDRMRL